MSRTKLVGIFFTILLLFGFAAYFVFQNLKTVTRDVPTLLNFYYTYKDQKPYKAKEALDLILQQEPNNIIARRALAGWYIQQGDTYMALSYLKKAQSRFPNDPALNLELAKLYLLLNQKNKAKPLLMKIMQMNVPESKQKATKIHQAFFSEEYAPEQWEITPYQSTLMPIPISNKEDLSPLFDKAMGLINTNPDEAKYYLLLILDRAPDSPVIYKTLGYLELKQHQTQQALSYFLKSYFQNQQPELALQIGFLYLKQEQKKQAEKFFQYASESEHASVRYQARQAIKNLNNPSQPQRSSFNAKPLSLKGQLLVAYYEKKKSNPKMAWQILKRLLRQFPNDLFLIKEAAYLSASMDQNQNAISFWQRAYQLEKKPEYALSIAYLYEKMDKRPQAFQYFGLAAKTRDKTLRDKAETALTNLAGTQTKYVPSPFFVDIFTSPLYFSRFDMMIYPVILRAGVIFEEQHSTALYLTHRRTTDSRSGIQNRISQIFEDNVAIYSIGLLTNPFKNVPLQAFIDVGEAEDLVFRNRAKWREDVRGGLVYYNEWGARPDFTFELELPMKWRTTLYGDLIYYSRYDNNVIGTLWFRPGLRAATFQSASVDVYVANYLVLDKNKEFFNNTYSIGPGIAIQPSNRWNIVFRFESLQGFYFPVNSPSPNPYKSTFHNNIVLAEVFVRF